MTIAALDDLQTALNAHHQRPDANTTIDFFEHLGHEVLGLGGRRCVIALDHGRVAKLAWRKAGLADNEIEARLWAQARPELQTLLCPIKDRTDAGVLIQTRCLPIHPYAVDGADQVLRQLASAGITDTATNLGLLDQRIVCYDFCVLRADVMREVLYGQDTLAHTLPPYL
jgi:hypothetical protein